MVFKFINYNQNLAEECLKNWQNDTLFLFPNEISCQKTLFLAQQLKGITNSAFYTMEKWKNELFSSPLPLVDEDKRTFLWYLTLSEDDKFFFKIENYRQSVKLAHYFFEFWDELNEEIVTTEKINDILAESYNAENQMETFRKLQKIYDNYQKLLLHKKLSDTIFVKKIENLQFSDFAKFKKVVVANQFYFTNLEKELLKQTPIATKIIYLQLPETAFDTKSLQVLTNDFWQTGQTKMYHLFTANNPQEMAMQLAKTVAENNIQAIVDFRLKQQPYFSFLSHQKFQLPSENSLLQTNIGQFLHYTHSLLKGIKRDSNLLFIPLQALVKAFLQPFFFHYFCIIEISQDELNNFLQFYTEQSFLYVDIDGKFLSFYLHESPAKNYLQSFLLWLKSFADIHSLTEMIQYIDSENSKLINLVSSQEERYCSNFYDVLYETLADFASLELVINQENWKTILGKSQFKSAEILELLLYYFQTKKINYFFEEEFAKIKFMSLQDTRNLEFDSLAILNVVEGILPASHKTPFLFSENQRNKLGLKTYDAILKRDKYYFQRALAQTKNVYLFTIDNPDENTEPSSYLQELEWKGIKFQKQDYTFSYRTYYQSLVNNEEHVNPAPLNKDFFSVPYEDSDFPDNKIQLTAYPFMHVMKDSYLYYWQYVLKLKPRIIELTNDYEAKLIGNFVHEIFYLIWQRIREVYQGNKIHHHFAMANQNYVETAIRHIRQNNPIFCYCSPHNYADVYFEHILLPVLQQSIESFFYELENRFKLTDTMMNIRFEEKMAAKKWFALPNNKQVYLKAKADLLLETDTIHYIFDYKTGKHSSSESKMYELQLVFYEIFYYILQNDSNYKDINSYLYFVMDKKFHPFIKEDKQVYLDELKESFVNVFSDIIKNGYTLSEKKNMYENIEITRRDLQKRIKTCIKK
jgi:hypothetical protein